VPDGTSTLWLVEMSAEGEINALPVTDCALSLRAQPNAASNRGDSPGAAGASPAVEVRPSICDTTAATAVDGAGGALCAAGVVSVSTELTCGAVVAEGPASGGDGVTGAGAPVTGVLTTVCAETFGLASAGAASTFAVGEFRVSAGELLWDNDRVVPVVLSCEVFAVLCAPSLPATFPPDGLLAVGVGVDGVPVVVVAPVLGDGAVPTIGVVRVVGVVPVVAVPVVGVVPVVEFVLVVPVVPVVDDVPVFDDVPLEPVLPFEVEDEEPAPPVLESLGRAFAIPWLLARAAPTPNATANAPTRPT
jgi:hypothetical protein